MKSPRPNSIVHFAAPKEVNRDYNSDTFQVFRIRINSGWRVGWKNRSREKKEESWDEKEQTRAGQRERETQKTSK